MRSLAACIALSATACALPFSTSSSGSSALEEGDGLEPRMELVFQVVDEGCTLTQGYWKNHSDRETQPNRARPWPIDEDTDLCGTGWLDTLSISPRGDAFYILAHQYIAASLNVASGASAPADVSAALDEAEELMADCAIIDAERARALELSSLLDDYNNGGVGPGHCGDAPPPPPGEGEGEGECNTEVCAGEGEGESGEGEGESGEGEGETAEPEIPPFG
jgi:hypothetical protein